jgi:hypothetical protein
MRHTKNKNRRYNKFSKKNRRYNKFSKKNKRYNKFSKKKTGGLPFFRKKNEDEIILEKSKLAGIAIKNNITKNELFNMLIIQCCILYNEYIDIPKDTPEDEKLKTRLYKEELIPIIDKLKEIFKINSDILNDHFGSDIFGKPIDFADKNNTGITSTITQESKPLLTDDQIKDIVLEETKEENNIINDGLNPTSELPPPPQQSTISTPVAEAVPVAVAVPVVVEEENNTDIKVSNDSSAVPGAIPTESNINKLINELKTDMLTKEFTITTKINGNNPIQFEAGITYFIPFVEFLNRFIKLLEDCIDNSETGQADDTKIIKAAGIQGKERMMQGRVILAKSKTYRAMGLGKTSDKFGGGIISSMSAAITQKYRDLKTASKQFISKADEHVKQKYSYLLYFDTFIDTFKVNTKSNYALSKESFTFYDKIRNGKGTWSELSKSKWQDIKQATKWAASFVYRNKFLGTFNMLIWQASNVACVAAAPYPVLIPAAVTLSVGHWVLLVASAPFLSPPAVIIYKKEEIDKANKSIQNNTMKDLTESVESYRNIIFYIFGNEHDDGKIGENGQLNFKLEGGTLTTTINPVTTINNPVTDNI